MRWTAAELPDLRGRTAVVTGASSGLGLATSRELARAGARVVLAVRNVAKGREVATTVLGETEVRELDLGSLASVRRFASGWTCSLDILVNNAGIMEVPEGRTADGFELQIGTNHLGHFALTNLLLPHLTGRVVTVSSALAAGGRVDLDDLNWERRRYRSGQAYRDSKQANLLFTLELQRRLTESGSEVRAVAAHPGLVRTNLFGQIGGVRALVIGLGAAFIGQDVEHGALPILFAATENIPGNSYVGPDDFGHARGFPEFVEAPRSARDRRLAARLWDLSARLTRTDAGVPGRV